MTLRRFVNLDRWIALALAATASGCTMDFAPGSVVADTRVLGAEVIVQNDDDNANQTRPAPGETFDWRLLVVAPEFDATWTWVASACLAPDTDGGGVEGCLGDPIAVSGAAEATSDLPTLSVTIPSADELPADAQQVLIAGVVCPEGVPNLDEAALGAGAVGTGTVEGNQELVLCTDPETEQPVNAGEPFFTATRINLGNDANQRPRFSESPLRFESAEWPVSDPLPAEQTGCAQSEATPVELVARPEEDAPLLITMTGWTPEDRERFELVFENPTRTLPQQESLQISHFSTAGEFDRQFSFVDDDETTTLEVEWDTPLPGDVPEEGLVVRFFFVLRDGRGGVEWIERAACVTR